MSEQLDWLGRQELGIARAQSKAHRELGEDWTMRAALYLQRYAADMTEPFLMEDARSAAGRRIANPSNSKAWGAAAQYAAKRNWIKRVGYAPAKSSNGSPKCLWSVA